MVSIRTGFAFTLRQVVATSFVDYGRIMQAIRGKHKRKKRNPDLHILRVWSFRYVNLRVAFLPHAFDCKPFVNT